MYSGNIVICRHKSTLFLYLLAKSHSNVENRLLVPVDIAEFSTAKRLLVEIYGEMLVHRCYTRERKWREAVSLSLHFRASGKFQISRDFFSVSERRPSISIE